MSNFFTFHIWIQDWVHVSLESRFIIAMYAQVQLKQVIPRTQEEQMEYSLAAERRRMRLIHAEIITDLLSSCSAQTGERNRRSFTFSRCVCLFLRLSREITCHMIRVLIKGVVRVVGISLGGCRQHSFKRIYGHRLLTDGLKRTE